MLPFTHLSRRNHINHLGLEIVNAIGENMIEIRRQLIREKIKKAN
jgi:hypothetical protein